MDTKALFTQRFDAARTALAVGNEPAAAEALHWAIVAARSDAGLRRELASALFHLGKLSRKLGKAGEAEAGPLLNEALTISEELFGSEHAALAPMLNELSRLHLQQSQHGRAEKALERLLAIARAKGEEHADVAAALAGLAFVKRKVGDDASAETLYRDALRIRERVLEPDHTITVGTLEQLSETCAARGNFIEALALLKRALPVREATLGASHERVRAARSRVAELELQVAIAADTSAKEAARAARDATPTPAWLTRVPDTPADTPSAALPSPRSSKELHFVGDAEPLALRPAPRPRERSKTPAVAAAVAAASLMASSIKTPAVSQMAIAPETARPSEVIANRESSAMHRDVVLADVEYREVSNIDAAAYDRRSAAVSSYDETPVPTRKKRPMVYVSATMAAVAIAIAALLMTRPRGSAKDAVAAETTVAQNVAATPAAAVVAAAMTTASSAAASPVGTARADSFHAASATAAHPAAATPPDQHAAETVAAAPELRAPTVNVHVDPVNTSNVPATVTFDSVVRARAAAQRASDTDRTRMVDVLARPTVADADAQRIPPKIIGRVPEPVFPDALLRRGKSEGLVIVRFMVNENGSVDSESMIVEQSDHELFTEAVRDVLPMMHFQPARVRSGEWKPVVAWVSVPFRFQTKKKH